MVRAMVDSQLRIAKWIYGTAYSSSDLDQALKVASGESDWVGRHSDLLYATLLFAASALCVALTYSVLQRSRLGRGTNQVVERLLISAQVGTYTQGASGGSDYAAATGAEINPHPESSVDVRQ